MSPQLNSPQAARLQSVFLPLNKLFLSPTNVRKVEPSGISELAQMIAAQGLLNPIFVTASNHSNVDAPQYGVEAGGRRLRALQLLRDDGKISADHLIECRVIDQKDAVEISLTENISQQEMSPPDEFEAYSTLVKKGQSIASVANKFGVTELHVQRRMKMANLAPELFTLYREGEITLDQVTALAATDDQGLQMQVWNSLPTYSRSSWQIKKQMFQEDVSANDKRLKIVSLDEYKAAGGEVRVDLFSEDAKEVLVNPALLDELVAKRIEQRCQALRDAGWGWVESRNEAVYRHSIGSQYVFPSEARREPTPDEKANLLEIQSKVDALDTQMNDLDMDDDEEGSKYESLAFEKETLENALEALNDALIDTSFSDKAQRGVIVYPSHDGIETLLGLTKKGSATGDIGKNSSTQGSTKSEFSEKLMLDMSSHVTSALQASLIAAPNVALASLASRMAETALSSHSGYTSPVRITLEAQQYQLEKNSNSVKDSKGANQMQAEIAKWKALLPNDSKTWLDWFIGQPQSVSVEMIVLGTALSTSAVHSNGSVPNRAASITKAVNLDMADWWEASPETYLNSVTKAKRFEAVTQAAGEATAKPMEKMGKAESIDYAKAHLAGKRWLPSFLTS